MFSHPIEHQFSQPNALKRWVLANCKKRPELPVHLGFCHLSQRWQAAIDTRARAPEWTIRSLVHPTDQELQQFVRFVTDGSRMAAWTRKIGRQRAVLCVRKAFLPVFGNHQKKHGGRLPKQVEFEAYIFGLSVRVRQEGKSKVSTRLPKMLRVYVERDGFVSRTLVIARPEIWSKLDDVFLSCRKKTFSSIPLTRIKKRLGTVREDGRTNSAFGNLNWTEIVSELHAFGISVRHLHIELVAEILRDTPKAFRASLNLLEAEKLQIIKAKIRKRISTRHGTRNSI